MCLYEILEVIYVPEMSTTVHIRDAMVKVRCGLIRATKLCLTEKYFTLLPLFFLGFFFFLSLKFLLKKCIEISYTLHPVFPNVSILCNHSIGSKPGNGLLCDSQSLFRFLQFSLHSFVCVNSSVQFYDLCRFM